MKLRSFKRKWVARNNKHFLGWRLNLKSLRIHSFWKTLIFPGHCASTCTTDYNDSYKIYPTDYLILGIFQTSVNLWWNEISKSITQMTTCHHRCNS